MSSPLPRQGSPYASMDCCTAFCRPCRVTSSRTTSSFLLVSLFLAWSWVTMVMSQPFTCEHRLVSVLVKAQAAHLAGPAHSVQGIPTPTTTALTNSIQGSNAVPTSTPKGSPPWPEKGLPQRGSWEIGIASLLSSGPPQTQEEKFRKRVPPTGEQVALGLLQLSLFPGGPGCARPESSLPTQH